MHIIYKTEHRSVFCDFPRLTVMRAKSLVPPGTQGHLCGPHAAGALMSSCCLGRGAMIQVVIQMSLSRDE